MARKNLVWVIETEYLGEPLKTTEEDILEISNSIDAKKTFLETFKRINPKTHYLSEIKKKK